MAYEAYDLICRRCAAKPMPEDELIAYLDKFVNELTSEEKVTEETYRKRMEKCSACEHRAEATCRLCGCFCQARTAMKNMQCPIPFNPKWNKEQ